MVQFVNSRERAVDVYWLDFTGKERRYARVEPGRAATLASFTGHVWRVRDATRAGSGAAAAGALGASASVSAAGAEGELVATVAVRGRVAPSEPDMQRIVVL